MKYLKKFEDVYDSALLKYEKQKQIELINKLKDLVRKLKKENDVRSTDMNKGDLSDYNNTVKVHTYNNTLDIIKQIESIIGPVTV